MWDFSWLERRAPGGGYEDWDQALAELAERGYDAVRIDAFPHLIAHGPTRAWHLTPVWSQERWGSTEPISVTVLPDLVRFIERCQEHRVVVALSSWFRQDRLETRLRIRTPQDLVEIWRMTLAVLEKAGVLDAIVWVDLCNEFPLEMWAPFVDREEAVRDRSMGLRPGGRWMKEAIAGLRASYPQLTLTFSFDAEDDRWPGPDLAFLDLLELHIWMAQWSDFYARVGYVFDLFGPSGYDALAARGEAVYRSDPDRWLSGLREGIAGAAAWSRQLGRPLATTEGWGVINFRDDPRLDWGWVKELCDVGVSEALRTERWVALCTSNFCGPQFSGMWDDVAWHRRLTDRIHSAHIAPFDSS
ncbi:MAG: cellulase [Chloroflexota bacterium]|nr:cellulase [Chloroflexota bacterium]